MFTRAKQGDGSGVSVILYFADDANVCEFSLFVVKRETCSTLASSHAAGHSLRSGQAAVSNADDEVSNSHTFASPADKVYREHRNRPLVHKKPGRRSRPGWLFVFKFRQVHVVDHVELRDHRGRLAPVGFGAFMRDLGVLFLVVVHLHGHLDRTDLKLIVEMCYDLVYELFARFPLGIIYSSVSVLMHMISSGITVTQPSVLGIAQTRFDIGCAKEGSDRVAVEVKLLAEGIDGDALYIING